LLRVTQFWRAYNANSASGKLGVQRNFIGTASNTFGQGPQQAASVFNFFSPFYAPPGEIANGDMVAPEMQIATEYLAAQQANFYYTQAFARTHLQAAALTADDMYIDVSDEYGLAADSEALVNRVAERLLGGSSQISATLKSEVKAQIERTAVDHHQSVDGVSGTRRRCNLSASSPRPSTRCSADRTENIMLTQPSSVPTCRSRWWCRVCVRSHGRYDPSANERGRRLPGLQSARLFVFVRWQRFLEYVRADEHRGIQRVLQSALRWHGGEHRD
jgi:hypothetical protein